METPITGIHHVTAIATDPQENVNFYVGLLGLRLVKRTVNFDDPSAYHFYYGDEAGSPGSIITFFYWPGMAGRGRIGAGQPSSILFSAPEQSLTYWADRLQADGRAVHRSRIFHEEALQFDDPDGICLKIVGVKDDARRGWSGSAVPSEHALRGLHAVELTVRISQMTERMIGEQLGFGLEQQDGKRARYAVGKRVSGSYLDIIEDAKATIGVGGAGTIHHVAWSVPDDEAELRMQKRLQGAGLGVSDVRDRDYFHSVYFREPSGILFEIATENPGFAKDEPPEALGTRLKLPKQFADAREEIESALPPVRVPVYHGKGNRQ